MFVQSMAICTRPRIKGTSSIPRKLARNCLILLCVYYLTQVALVHLKLGSASNSDRKFTSKDVSTVKLISERNGFAYVLFYNYGYLDLVKSFVSNLLVVDPEVLINVIFVAGDRTAANALKAFKEDLLVYQHDVPEIVQGVSFGSFEYYFITLQRLLLQNSLIQAGANIMVIEADAVWTSPRVTENILEYLTTADIVSADDLADGFNRLISAGFLACKSTEAVRIMFKEYAMTYQEQLMKYEGVQGEISLQGEQWMMTRMINTNSISLNWFRV